MSKKTQREIEDKAERAAWMLKQHGFYHFPNDEPGVGAAVEGLLRRRYPNSDLIVEEPPRGFGGEFVFRSASHLGAKASGG